MKTRPLILLLESVYYHITSGDEDLVETFKKEVRLFKDHIAYVIDSCIDAGSVIMSYHFIIILIMINNT